MAASSASERVTFRFLKRDPHGRALRFQGPHFMKFHTSLGIRKHKLFRKRELADKLLETRSDFVDQDTDTNQDRLMDEIDLERVPAQDRKAPCEAVLFQGELINVDGLQIDPQ